MHKKETPTISYDMSHGSAAESSGWFYPPTGLGWAWAHCGCTFLWQHWTTHGVLSGIRPWDFVFIGEWNISSLLNPGAHGTNPSFQLSLGGWTMLLQQKYGIFQEDSHRLLLIYFLSLGNDIYYTTYVLYPQGLQLILMTMIVIGGSGLWHESSYRCCTLWKEVITPLSM